LLPDNDKTNQLPTRNGMTMTTRRSRARETALQVLFEIDLVPQRDNAQRRAFLDSRLKDKASRDLAWGLVMGTMRHREDLDRRISQAADNWRITRMACVDRNVLRLAVYELTYARDAALGIVFDEAIELAGRFGSEGSKAFVNGVLDRCRKDWESARAELGLPPLAPASGQAG
jgi:N utilization substance protein B